MFKKAKEISDDKVQIAIQTYELVDKHIRKLDSDLAKFESEMKVMIIVLNVSNPPFRSRQIQGFNDQKLRKNFTAENNNFFAKKL
jgi:hypothetical protein